MAATTETALKLLVDTNTKKVVFAEARKDFVDLLFGFLQVPVGSIVKKLSENGMEWPGSIGKVYKSVTDLESSYFPHHASKDLLLWPDMSSSSKSISIPPLLQNFASPERSIQTNETNCFTSTNVGVFGCSSTGPFGSTSTAAFGSTATSTPAFGSTSTPAFGSSLASSEPEGFVSEMTQYMVMDDLTVKPLSPISTITLLNSIGVKDFSSLVEKNVTINFNKWLELVKTSFASNTVLSDVFVKQPGTTADTETLERQTSKDE